MIITVMSNKGGVGKTTMATIIAEMAYLDVRKDLTANKVKPEEITYPLVCGFDFDLQKNFEDNFKKPEDNKKRKSKKERKLTDEDFLDYVTIRPRSLRKLNLDEIVQAGEQFKYVVIDTPPSLDEDYFDSLVKISDVVVVPFMTQKHSIEGLPELLGKLIARKKRYVTVHLEQVGVVKELIKILLGGLYDPKGGNEVPGSVGALLCGIRMDMYANVEKNIFNKSFFWKSLRDKTKDKFKSLWDKVVKTKEKYDNVFFNDNGAPNLIRRAVCCLISAFLCVFVPSCRF